MNRAELERMTLDELYRVAAEHGLREAPGLPREQVIDELLERMTDAAAAKKPAGEPAAKAAPTSSTIVKPRASGAGIPSSMAPDRPGEQDPEAMAHLYLAQGDNTRAIELFKELLAVRPDDESLAAGLAAAEGKLREQAPYTPAEPEIEAAPPPRHADEPMGMLDLEEPPEAYGVDECEVIAQNPHHVFVYWEVTDHGLAAARADLGDEGANAKLVLRLFATQGAGERGPEREQRDHALDWNHGRRYLPSPRPGARVRAAVGLLTQSGLFAPIAQSSQVRVPPSEPAANVSSDWMEVTPARRRGLVPEPIQIAERGPEAAERGPSSPGAPARESAPAEVAPEPGDHEHARPGSPWRWRPGSQS